MQEAFLFCYRCADDVSVGLDKLCQLLLISFGESFPWSCRICA